MGRLFSEQSADTAEDAVLLGIVGVVFAGYLEDGREGGCVGVYFIADFHKPGVMVKIRNIRLYYRFGRNDMTNPKTKIYKFKENGDKKREKFKAKSL